MRCELGDKGLVYLRKFKNIKVLNINENKVSPQMFINNYKFLKNIRLFGYKADYK